MKESSYVWALQQSISYSGVQIVIDAALDKRNDIHRLEHIDDSI